MPRHSAGLAFDSARGRLVLFGGSTGNLVSSSSFFGDTWEWDGSARTERTPGFGPTARRSMRLAFDSARNRTVLYGGYENSFVDRGDTWEWDGAAWRQVAATGPGPLSDYGMTFDSMRNRTVLYGAHSSVNTAYSETWEWDGAAWTQRVIYSPPGAGFGLDLAFDRAHARTVLFTGKTLGLSGVTWLWDGTTWTAPSSTPAARDQTAMAWDSVRRRLVLFGGHYYVPGPIVPDAFHGDTWEWDGTVWALRATTGPAARAGHAMAFDSSRNLTVMFGGARLEQPNPPISRVLGDTWEWDGTTWVQRANTGPLSRELHGLVFDSARNRTVMFGGLHYDPGVPGANLADLWEWDGSGWMQRQVLGPSARNSFGFAFDSGRGRAIMFGGTPCSNGNPCGDTWEYDGVAWYFRDNMGPPARASTALAYDAARARTVLFAGRQTSVAQADTWEWDGSAWSQIASGGSLSLFSHAMAYDGFNRRTIVFGGFTTSYLLASTFAYHTRGDACGSGAECDTASCVDGVCCEATSCGICQACDTSTAPGQCTVVTGAPDPDTCAGTQMCSADGHCGSANGQPCSPGVTDCASGYCVDGVCCGDSCSGPCHRCDFPGTTGSPDGVCRIPVGGDPDGDCGGQGPCHPLCTSSGSCGFPGREHLCATCTACDGAGSCDQLPSAADDPACMTIDCQARSTECRHYRDATAMRCIVIGTCAPPGDPSVCTQFDDLRDGSPCTGGVCRAGACEPASSGHGAGGQSGGCGCVVSARPSSWGSWVWLGLVLWAWGARKRRR